jgi:hypothetical protein
MFGGEGEGDFEEFEGGAGFVLLDFGFACEGIASLTCDPSFGGGGVATALDTKEHWSGLCTHYPENHVDENCVGR